MKETKEEKRGEEQNNQYHNTQHRLLDNTIVSTGATEVGIIRESEMTTTILTVVLLFCYFVPLHCQLAQVQ